MKHPFRALSAALSLLLCVLVLVLWVGSVAGAPACHTPPGALASYNPCHGQATAVSVAPLTPDQAMAALLKVRPSDVAKLVAKEARAKKAGKKKRGK